MTEIDACDFA